MSGCAADIVNLVPLTLANRRTLEMDKDRQSLTELSLHLRSLRRDLAVKFSRLDAAAASTAVCHLKLQGGAFIKGVEALEASMNKLIGAMATHQPR
ncbi:hypothetical protein [Methylobacterium sp. R2-1]|uniref:hypothetical protein n=1 Tax=Methylobacterium sp. R2-1 TaxID=2587064 RepID=UPI0016113048|nr:hypothetical protein [Methylobacterium sp. R2-1]MBB2964759.1 hypothetical protein [Methylobacterium sp. R2-1]